MSAFDQCEFLGLCCSSQVLIPTVYSEADCLLALETGRIWARLAEFFSSSEKPAAVEKKHAAIEPAFSVLWGVLLRETGEVTLGL